MFPVESKNHLQEATDLGGSALVKVLLERGVSSDPAIIDDILQFDDAETLLSTLLGNGANVSTSHLLNVIKEEDGILAKCSAAFAEWNLNASGGVVVIARIAGCGSNAETDPCMEI